MEGIDKIPMMLSRTHPFNMAGTHINKGEQIDPFVLISYLKHLSTYLFLMPWEFGFELIRWDNIDTCPLCLLALLRSTYIK